MIMNQVDVKESSCSTVQIFEKKEFGEVRIALINSEPWFCLPDLCRVLGISNTTQVKDRLKPREVYLLDLDTLCKTEGLIINKLDDHHCKCGKCGNTKINFVSESGFYRTILRSNSPLADPFQEWVTSEVLPSIRKTGSYSVNQEPLAEIQLLQKAVDALEEQGRIQKEHAEQLNAVSSRVTAIEERHDRLLAELAASPLSPDSPPELSIRRKCVECVNDYCRATGLSQRDVWTSIYRGLYYHFGINIQARKRAPKETLLDIAEKIGCIDKIYMLITDLLKRISLQQR